MFDAKRKSYTFDDGAKALIFKQHLQNTGYFGAQIRKSLPEFKGHLNQGYTVYFKARTIAEEMEVNKLYKSEVK